MLVSFPPNMVKLWMSANILAVGVWIRSGTKYRTFSTGILNQCCTWCISDDCFVSKAHSSQKLTRSPSLNPVGPGLRLRIQESAPGTHDKSLGPAGPKRPGWRYGASGSSERERSPRPSRPGRPGGGRSGSDGAAPTVAVTVTAAAAAAAARTPSGSVL